MKRPALVLLPAVVLLSLWLILGASGSTQEQRRGQIRVETNLVDILASVIDAQGQPVPGLTQDQFELSEEGVP